MAHIESNLKNTELFQLNSDEIATLSIGVVSLGNITHAKLNLTFEYTKNVGALINFTDNPGIINTLFPIIFAYSDDGVYNVGKFSGIITENQTPVSRLVRLHLSSTGEFVGETVSSAVDGSYTIETPFEGEHYVVAFDDEAGDVYNAVIQDKLMAQDI